MHWRAAAFDGDGPVRDASRGRPNASVSSPSEVCALIGVAPFNRHSGAAFRGERMIFGGRAAVRRMLYMRR
ncbi:transposase [Caballeronia grimmiae]|uniref:transposase n=1 Tax=Caballeronia grimmiae TaxID=1071679 RepID=UPI0038B9AC71